MIVRETIGDVLGAMRTQPLGVAIVLICTLFAGVMVYTLREVSGSIERRDMLLSGLVTDMLKACNERSGGRS